MPSIISGSRTHNHSTDSWNNGVAEDDPDDP